MIERKKSNRWAVRGVSWARPATYAQGHSVFFLASIDWRRVSVRYIRRTT